MRAAVRSSSDDIPDEEIVEEVTEVTKEEEEDPLTFAQQIALAHDVTKEEHAAYEAAQARKAEKHAKGQAAALAAFQAASKAAPPQMKKGANRKSFAKLGATGRLRPGAAVLKGFPAVPPGGNSRGEAAEGASQQAGDNCKNKVPEQGTKKAPARETEAKKAAAGISF
ncbi:hypothetical protein KFL_012820010 [Klebsormidium nitens]|uniref:Uncharacterized protein n=1 Tax=Klebsormidium nitens TaxID=105231 RepID=A0A1Y1IQD5_KLENI|nr:hypothetical protein KFL_012820010 [Klebsormidium nitens]|eukprot:GAQ93070.1 hypothetical protein KFL_012820010 [Klebsormidium nitens]